MNIKILKLKNSEELLCDLVEETDDSYTIKNPCQLIPSGQQGLALVPWIPFGEFDRNEGVIIYKDVVILCVGVIEEIESQYEQQFSTVIAPSSKKKIVTPGDLRLST
jgi:hypothetical protein